MKHGLNLGSGHECITDTATTRWLNIDADASTRPDVLADVRCIPADLSVDEIIAKDVLEHLPVSDWKDAVALWVSLLKPGGTIFIQVPSPECIFRQFQAGNIDEATMNRVIYGECTSEWDRHYQLFTLDRLAHAMEDCGLDIIEAKEVHVCAIVVGRKPELDRTDLEMQFGGNIPRRPE